MAKIAVDVLLVDGTNEETFISSFDDIPEVELKNRLPNSPTLLVLRVEESYISTLESDSRVVAVEIPPPVFEPIAPIHDSEEYAEQNKIIEHLSTKKVLKQDILERLNDDMDKSETKKNPIRFIKILLAIFKI